jgi:hypothetical protein
MRAQKEYAPAYRRQAATLRAMAERMTNAKQKADYLLAAAAFDRFAALLEKDIGRSER